MAPAKEWPVRSTGEDFWHLDARSTFQRWRSEKAVRDYARAKVWSEIRFRHVPELLREVRGALWSATVRDLMADAFEYALLGCVLTASGEESRRSHILSTAYPEKLPRRLRRIAKPTPPQMEAVEMLRAVAEIFVDPLRPGTPLADLDESAKRVARSTGRKLDPVRDDFAEPLGIKGKTLARLARREREKKGNRKRRG